MFLVPLSAEGVEIHPVRTLGGERTNVTFYTDVRVSDLYRVGDVDRGWDVLITALTHERTGVGRYGKNVRLLEAALAYHAAAETLSGEDRAALQGAIARLTLENEVSRLLARQTVWAEADGRLAGVEGSMSKLWTSESLVRASSELARLVPDALFAHDLGPIEVLSKMLRHAPVTTIYGGTSEIQRGIIASRQLNIAKVG
jgi:alkylation response protein AidB-like acyl-CoA dehydrogenase